jgi:hypothetical protein
VSAHSAPHITPQTPEEYAALVRKLRAATLVVAIVGTALCGLAWQADIDRFLQAYLVAWIFWVGISAGSLGVLLVHRLTGGVWGVAISRSAERAAAILPLLAVLFIPVVLNLPRLYPWARPDVVNGDVVLEGKAVYLNPDAFTMRSAGYLILWSLLALLLRGVRRWQLFGNVSGLGLAAYFLSGTFAAIDWMMSLEPHWYSSTFGPMFVIGQALTGLSAGVLGTLLFAPRTRSFTELLGAALRDLNNMVLAFVMLWAYIAFTQYLIIYYGNLSEEAVWYVERTHGGWGWIALALPVFHFIVPFLALVNGAGKFDPRALAWITAGILVIHWFDIYWLVMPAFSPGQLNFSWLDPAVAVTLGAWWLLAWLLQLRPASDESAEGK